MKSESDKDSRLEAEAEGALGDAEDGIVVAFAALLPDLFSAIAALFRALDFRLGLQRPFEVIHRLVDLIRVELQVAARAQRFRRERPLRVAVDQLYSVRDGGFFSRVGMILVICLKLNYKFNYNL